jgi:hypothetical protein
LETYLVAAAPRGDLKNDGLNDAPAIKEAVLEMMKGKVSASTLLQ